VEYQQQLKLVAAKVGSTKSTDQAAGSFFGRFCAF
jgi:hypothetical protein